MSDPADLVWLDVLPGNFWWTNWIEGVRFGESLEQAYAVPKVAALTDTGSSCVLVSTQTYIYLLTQILKLIDTFYYFDFQFGWGYVFDCVN